MYIQYEYSEYVNILIRCNHNFFLGTMTEGMATIDFL